MSQTMLKWLRLVTPGVLLFVLWGILGWSTNLWPAYWPSKIQEILPTLGVIVPGAIYYLTPLRHLSNRHYFRDVTETLRRRLVEIAKVQDDPHVYSWQKLRGIFFTIIDGDVSLTKKSSLAYFNGYIWTTLADLRALSLCTTLFAFLFWISGVSSAGGATIILLSITLLTIPASGAVTRRHKEIGEQQIEIIELEYLDKLRERLGRVRDRSNSVDSDNSAGP
jgi:hypothetical protein